jgi:hypothetical protein
MLAAASKFQRLQAAAGKAQTTATPLSTARKIRHKSAPQAEVNSRLQTNHVCARELAKTAFASGQLRPQGCGTRGMQGSAITRRACAQLRSSTHRLCVCPCSCATAVQYERTASAGPRRHARGHGRASTASAIRDLQDPPHASVEATTTLTCAGAARIADFQFSPASHPLLQHHPHLKGAAEPSTPVRSAVPAAVSSLHIKAAACVLEQYVSAGGKGVWQG